MAIKVIKHGTKVFRAVCSICGCEFEYEYEDLKTEYGFVRQVKCPDCGNFVTHQDFTPQQPHIPTYPSWPTYPHYPYVTWTTTGTGTELDCDKCPNKPSSDKITIGDTPCTWCKKNQPYCYTGDKFPKDYKGGEYKATCFAGPYKYTNTDGHINVSYVTPYPKETVNLDTNYTTDKK